MSALTLVLDGSTHSASVALLRDGAVIAESRVPGGADGNGGRGEALVPLIAKLLDDNGLAAARISEVICGAGPGSFTSLRVAASVAKGIASAAGARMYAVSSLMLVLGGAREHLRDGNYLTTLPAMRGELFALPVTITEGVPMALAPRHSIIEAAEVHAEAKRHNARVVGAEQEVDATPHARGVAALYPGIVAGGPVDLDSWEPDYGRLAEAQVKWEAAHGRPLKA